MKKVAVLFAEGFEEIEALTVVDIMRRANVTCHMIGIDKINVLGTHSIQVKCDKTLDNDIKDYDLIVLPGGMPGAKNLQENKKVIEAVKYFNESGKLVSAICAAPIVLGTANIIENRNITSYPGFEDELKGCNYKEDRVVVDGNIITSRGPATAMEFAYKLLEILGNDKYKDISSGMLFS
jgi:4-methyl-5(b-hydroxyethyl)-thiazole monophosphate biosynthesis